MNLQYCLCFPPPRHANLWRMEELPSRRKRTKIIQHSLIYEINSCSSHQKTICPQGHSHPAATQTPRLHARKSAILQGDKLHWETASNSSLPIPRTLHWHSAYIVEDPWSSGTGKSWQGIFTFPSSSSFGPLLSMVLFLCSSLNYKLVLPALFFY